MDGVELPLGTDQNGCEWVRTRVGANVSTPRQVGKHSGVRGGGGGFAIRNTRTCATQRVEVRALSRVTNLGVLLLLFTFFREQARTPPE